MKFLKTAQFGLQLHNEHDVLYDHIKILFYLKIEGSPG